MKTPPETIYRFGPFAVDPSAGELLKQGKRVKIQDQPFRLLLILLENAGEVVIRAEIQGRIWEVNTFVDFDISLRVAVGKLREALEDDAGSPHYVETIPRRGYRFLGPWRQPHMGPTQRRSRKRARWRRVRKAREDRWGPSGVGPWRWA